MLNRAIPSQDVLNSHHLISSQLCAFGCDTIETLDHLFLSCPLSRAIWFGFLSMTFSSLSGDYSQPLQGLSFFINNLLERKDDEILIQLIFMLHKIWELRNLSIQKGKLLDPHAAIKEIRHSTFSQQ